MKIAVLWWTWRIGNLVILQALARWREVVALVRDASKLTVKDEHLTVIIWNATKEDDVAKTISGIDCVIHAVSVWLMHQHPTHLYSTVTKNVLSCIDHDKQKYIVMSSMWTHHIRKSMPFIIRQWYEILLWDVADDKELEEKLIIESTINRTIIKAPLLTNWEKSDSQTLPFESYHLTIDRISRKTIAHAICDICTQNIYNKQKIVITAKS